MVAAARWFIDDALCGTSEPGTKFEVAVHDRDRRRVMQPGRDRGDVLLALAPDPRVFRPVDLGQVALRRDRRISRRCVGTAASGRPKAAGF